MVESDWKTSGNPHAGPVHRLDVHMWFAGVAGVSAFRDLGSPGHSIAAFDEQGALPEVGE